MFLLKSFNVTQQTIKRSSFDGSAWSTPETILTGHVGEQNFSFGGCRLYFVHLYGFDGFPSNRQNGDLMMIQKK